MQFSLASFKTSHIYLIAAAVTLFTGWTALLDSFHGMFLAYAKRSDAIAAAHSKSQKWNSIMKQFRRSESSMSDEAYAIPGGHRSVARVLAEIIAIYCNMGKVLGGTLLLLYLLGVDLYSGLVALGLTVIFAGTCSALDINEAFKNVYALAISNALHVGEIISVVRAGFKPADNPGDFVVGFFEGCTWTHVIIRDFKVCLFTAARLLLSRDQCYIFIMIVFPNSFPSRESRCSFGTIDLAN